MHLEPQMLTELDTTLDLRGGKFFASCFGRRVPDDLLAALTVHGTATNHATVGFASPSATQDAMPLRIEHWDSVPAPDGEWDLALTTTVCVDTSGDLEWFSTDGEGGTAGVAVDFPIARGYYVLEAVARARESGGERWRVRIWHADEPGPDLKEIDRISRLAR
jgi:hypothetical protein